MAQVDFQIVEEPFRRCVRLSARVERLYDGCRWAEGPAYFPAQRCLLWSDIPNDRILRWNETSGAVSVFRSPSNYSNGNTIDRQGRLLTCEQGTRRLTRTEHDGTITVLADRFEGRRFNSPNDVVVKSDGSIWFTDPTYGIDTNYEGVQATSELDGSHVYRIDSVTGAVTQVTTDFVRPNGLAFSVDERRLYIADTGATHQPNGPRHIRVFDVDDNGHLSGGDVLLSLTTELFDGFRVDEAGRIWTSAGEAVHCYHPDGRLLGKILIGEPVANVVFGGPKRNRLFVCATTSLYSVLLPVNGAKTF